VDGTEAIRRSAKAMADLRESSGFVSDVLSTMNDIADRTNLLAMNASIEAAHAGAAGRGFGVIAQEIRKLAESSAANSRRIVETMQKMNGSIDLGAELSARAEDSFRKVSEGIRKHHELSLSAARTTAAQAEDTKEIGESAGKLLRAAEGLSALADRQDERRRELEGLSRETGEASKGINVSAEAQKASVTEIVGAIEELERVSKANRLALDSILSLMDAYVLGDKGA
jgi:methyl-accepting chemotaxis protein